MPLACNASGRECQRCSQHCSQWLAAATTTYGVAGICKVPLWGCLRVSNPPPPQISPDGTHVAFVHDAEVYVMPLDGSAPARQVTTGARGTGRTHGVADYIAQEEMGRMDGFWWSPDGDHIAFQGAVSAAGSPCSSG